MNEVQVSFEEMVVSVTREPVLLCSNLCKTYDEGDLAVRVLNGVNFDIYPGESTAIIGPSGSGKSTLLHCLGGLDKPSSGDVIICGNKLQDTTEIKLSQIRNKYLGFVYQFHHLLPEFTALENVALPLMVQGVTVEQATDRANDMLKRVGLAERTQHYPAQLSGGERQRTALARALVTEPKCLLADEPTGNLDHQTAQNVVEMIAELKQALGTSIIIVTHDIRLAQQMDQIYNLEDGTLTAL